MPIAQILHQRFVRVNKNSSPTSGETVTLPLDFCSKCAILKSTITSEKEAIRMFGWFQSLVSIRFQELSQLRRELRNEANK